MIANALLLAVREIRHNLMRSLLTTLGVAIGVAAVIAMVSLGSAATRSITSDIASMGRNLLIIIPGERRPGTLTSASPFDMEDVDALRRDVSSLSVVAPMVQRSTVAVNGNRSRTTPTTGTTNEFFTAREWPLAEGREFAATELAAGKAVCIVGETVREELFGAQRAIGADIRIGKISCGVIGVLSVKGQSTMGPDQDDIVVMPIRAVQRRIAGNTDVGMIWASVRDASQTEQAKSGTETLLRERRHIGTGAASDFQVNDLQEISRLVQNTTAILTAFLSAVAAVSLLVGGIGIMNIMLVSVTERTREIGIRLAIGARARDVLLQFLIEAVAMSGLGGVFGILVGLAGSAIGASALKLPFVFEPWIVLIAVVFSAAVGVAFGYFPARRAARLDPIEALRHE